ncbi:MAG: hypothetical protein GVY16_11440 [Planctomycetes bacterium]|nr:hypothetical protein [Planctomycetota bacterium]
MVLGVPSLAYLLISIVLLALHEYVDGFRLSPEVYGGLGIGFLVAFFLIVCAACLLGAYIRTRPRPDPTPREEATGKFEKLACIAVLILAALTAIGTSHWFSFIAGGFLAVAGVVGLAYYFFVLRPAAADIHEDGVLEHVERALMTRSRFLWWLELVTGLGMVALGVLWLAVGPGLDVVEPFRRYVYAGAYVVGGIGMFRGLMDKSRRKNVGIPLGESVLDRDGHVAPKAVKASTNEPPAKTDPWANALLSPKARRLRQRQEAGQPTSGADDGT